MEATEMTTTLESPSETLHVLDDLDDNSEYHLVKDITRMDESWCGLKAKFWNATYLEFSMKPCKPCIKARQQHDDLPKV